MIFYHLFKSREQKKRKWCHKFVQISPLYRNGLKAELVVPFRAQTTNHQTAEYPKASQSGVSGRQDRTPPHAQSQRRRGKTQHTTRDTTHETQRTRHNARDTTHETQHTRHNTRDTTHKTRDLPSGSRDTKDTTQATKATIRTTTHHTHHTTRRTCKTYSRAPASEENTHKKNAISITLSDKPML